MKALLHRQRGNFQTYKAAPHNDDASTGLELGTQALGVTE
jgi:hypothetical protein